jgi:oligopeptide transport system permease protein
MGVPMIWRMARNFIVILAIVLGFILLLLVPREFPFQFIDGKVITHTSVINMEHYKTNILDFYQFLKEKGFGTTSYGEKVTDNSNQLFIRSLRIVIPSFMASIVIGIIAGSIQFRFRHHLFGKLLAFLNWLFSSIPDFFLYIAIQYLFIKLYVAGLLPNFNLYGSDNWYSSLFPAFALAIFPIIHIAKFIFSSLLQESEMDYVRTSLAKGMSQFKILLHMLRNGTAALLNQIQMIMLYILSGLPVFEKITDYHGAAYQLVTSIRDNEDNRALALMLPFLFLMIGVIALSQFIKFKMVPVKRGES